MRSVYLILLFITALFARFDSDIEKAQDLMAKESYIEAKDLLIKLEEKYRKNKLEYAYILHTKAFVFYNQNSYNEAKKEFYKALDQKALPENTTTNTLLILAQLELYTKEFQKALDLMKQIDKLGIRSVNRYLIEAQIYIELSSYDKAYIALKEVVKIEPKISHMRTLASICVELERYSEAEDIYKQNIISDESNKSDFLNLFYLYILQEKTASAVDVLSVASSAKMLEADDEKTYARSLLSNAIPMRAARVLSDLMIRNKIDRNRENLELLAISYRYAKEHKLATKTYLEIFEITKDINYLETALSISYETLDYKAVTDLKDIYLNSSSHDEKYLFMIAISLYENSEYIESKKVFAMLENSKRYKKEAINWIRYLGSLHN